MSFVMFEKTPLGYTELVCGSKFWEDECGQLHREYGPASIGVDGRMDWYCHGTLTKSLNVEDDDVQIERIMEVMDLNKIHKAMKSVDWKWGGFNFEITPSAENLKIEALRILRDLKKYRRYEEPCSIATGGFEGTA